VEVDDTQVKGEYMQVEMECGDGEGVVVAVPRIHIMYALKEVES
jgi:hypothetical protein